MYGHMFPIVFKYCQAEKQGTNRDALLFRICIYACMYICIYVCTFVCIVCISVTVNSGHLNCAIATDT